MESYNGSERHLENARKAKIIAIASLKDKKQKRIEEYYKNPKRCLKCESPIDYSKKRIGKFCSSSCSASYTQIGKKHSKNTCNKIRKALTGKISPLKGRKIINKSQYKNRKGSKSCIIHYKICKACKKTYVIASAKKNYDNVTCSNCGRINRELALSNREWTCACGSVHDRDVNAAKNIKAFALQKESSVERRLKNYGELPTLVGALTREAHRSLVDG